MVRHYAEKFPKIPKRSQKSLARIRFQGACQPSAKIMLVQLSGLDLHQTLSKKCVVSRFLNERSLARLRETLAALCAATVKSSLKITLCCCVRDHSRSDRRTF